MTELSDADREMVTAIIDSTGLEWDIEYSDACADVLHTARRLVSAEILAAAKISEDEMVVAMIEQVYGHHSPDHLSRAASALG